MDASMTESIYLTHFRQVSEKLTECEKYLISIREYLDEVIRLMAEKEKAMRVPTCCSGD